MESEDFENDSMSKTAPIYNSGVEFVIQLSKLLWICTTASLENDLMLWSRTLRMVYNSASFYIKDDDRPKFEGVFEVLDVLPSPPFKFKNEENDFLRARLTLLEVDKELRFKLHEVGLLIPHGTDPRFAMRK